MQICSKLSRSNRVAGNSAAQEDESRIGQIFPRPSEALPRPPRLNLVSYLRYRFYWAENSAELTAVLHPEIKGCRVTRHPHRMDGVGDTPTPQYETCPQFWRDVGNFSEML